MYCVFPLDKPSQRALGLLTSLSGLLHRGKASFGGGGQRGALTCLYTMFKRSNCARGHRRHVHCRAQCVRVFLAAQSYPFCDFKEALSGRGCRPWMNIRFRFSSVRGCAPPLRGGYRGLALKSALGADNVCVFPARCSLPTRRPSHPHNSPHCPRAGQNFSFIIF